MILLLYLILQLDNLRIAFGWALAFCVLGFAVSAMTFYQHWSMAAPYDKEKKGEPVLPGVQHARDMVKSAKFWGRLSVLTGFLFVVLLILVPSTKSGLILMGLEKFRQLNAQVSTTGIYDKSLKLLEQKLDEALDKDKK